MQAKCRVLQPARVEHLKAIALQCCCIEEFVRQLDTGYATPDDRNLDFCIITFGA